VIDQLDRMALTRTVAPEVEPVSTAEAKLHCRVDSTADDAIFAALITAARLWCEEEAKRSFVTQSWNLVLPDFPRYTGESPATWSGGLARGWNGIPLPRPPVQAASVRVKYLDPSGASTDFTDFVVAAYEPAVVCPSPGKVWPVTQYQRTDAVSVSYDAGYGDAAADVPEPIKQAMKLMIGHWYENREAATLGVVSAPLAMAVDALLAPYRVWEYR
jgi:uncharacterized phiE125 gp8 family phage protein